MPDGGFRQSARQENWKVVRYGINSETELYDLNELPAWLCPGGSKNRTLDVQEYLWNLRFDQAFDEETTTSTRTIPKSQQEKK